MRALSACLLTLAALPALAAVLEVEDARTAPPVAGTAIIAGYLTLTNDGGKTVTVQGADSQAFARISLHRSVHAGGQARMKAVEALTLEPGERVDFGPGGLHLMMFEPKDELGVGDTLKLRLLTDVGAMPVEMHVIDRAELLRP